MPVRWLYVLADGSLGVLDGDGNYVGEGMASAENPIVGRVAYWTDDESCKVNVNVAAEAVPSVQPQATALMVVSVGISSPPPSRFGRRLHRRSGRGFRRRGPIARGRPGRGGVLA